MGTDLHGPDAAAVYHDLHVGAPEFVSQLVPLSSMSGGPPAPSPPTSPAPLSPTPPELSSNGCCWADSSPVSTATATSSTYDATIDSSLSSPISRWCAAPLHQLMSEITPTPASDAHRMQVLSYIESLIRKSLGAKIFPYGSLALKTYLPDADINVCAFFTHNHQKTWGQRALKALTRPGTPDSPAHAGLHVSHADLVSGNTPDAAKVIRARVADLTFEISANVSHGLSTCALFEEVDRLVDQQHLFKRSVLLCKAWARHDARIIDAQHGMLTSYVVRCLVLTVFNAYHDVIRQPMDALVMLWQYLAAFDWDRHAWDLYGPVYLHGLPRTSEPVRQHPTAFPSNVQPLVSKQLAARYGTSSSSPADAVFTGRLLNVIDPTNPSHNLTASLSRRSAAHIRSQLTEQSRLAVTILRNAAASAAAVADLLVRLIPGTMAKYGASTTTTATPRLTVHVPASYSLTGDLSLMTRHILQAGEFDMPDISERDLVELVVQILRENDGVVTVGKMGSLMHSATNNHSLPAMLKTRYGGLKKLLRRHENIFALAADHPHNPHVMLLPGYETALHMWTPPPPAASVSLPSSPCPSPVPTMCAPTPLTPASSSLLGNIWARPGSQNTSSGRGSSTSLLPPRPASVPVTPSWTSDPVWSIPAVPSPSAWMSSTLPEEFHCPITGALMRDPVVAQDGVTYDRSSLEMLRQANRGFSPLTGLPLDLTAVYPNLALKALLTKIRQDELVLTNRPSHSPTSARIGQYDHIASIWG
ncbi:U-box domain-containing protein [Plasmodiophora brassicae]